MPIRDVSSTLCTADVCEESCDKSGRVITLTFADTDTFGVTLAVYDLQSGFGTQNSSKNSNPPKFTFGTASRFLQPSAARAKRNPQVPGPGTYSAGSSIGKNPESNKINQAAFGFGTATRDDARRVFISAGTALRVSQIRGHTVLPKLVTVVHTSRYTRPAKGRLTSARTRLTLFVNNHSRGEGPVRG